MPYRSRSPDGIVDGSSILEIKCPVTSDINARIKSGVHDVKEGTNGKLYLCPKGRNGYYLQCQLLMHCAGFSHAYFYVWTPTCDVLVTVQYDGEFVSKFF